MIAPTTRFRIARVPLARIVVTEHQPRYPERALHYHRLLLAPEHDGHACGLVALTPYWDTAKRRWSKTRLTLLDGHHRYVGHILAGRDTLLAVIELTPGQPGYDTAMVAETWE